MSGMVIIYFIAMYVGLIVILTAVSIKKHGFQWPPASIAAAIALVMVLQRIKTGGSFNLIYLAGLAASMCLIYLVFGFIMRKLIRQ
ncbi:MAG: hypothetical protein E7430_04525 [Ruminococcaceae bacterium]|nr:hypothetical protein [Oscillospiraceae bacterium]